MSARSSRVKKLLSYTVVGYFSDNKQPFTCPVDAFTPEGAAGNAVCDLLEINGWEEDRASEVVVVAILGHNPGADIAVAYDLPEVASGASFSADSHDVQRAVPEVADVLAEAVLAT